MATAPAKPRRTPIVARKVRGLFGKGIVRIGSESRLELRDRLKMKRELFCRMVNVSSRTIAQVESTADEADKLQRPYNEVYRLTDALGEVADSDSLGAWFTTPNESLGGLKPLEIIERGEIDRLWDMVFRLRSGLPG